MPAVDDIDIERVGKSEAAPKVIEVYKTLKVYGSAQERTDWLKARKEAWDAVANNEMWDDDEKKEMKALGQVPLVINKCNKGVQGSSAVVTDSKPEVKFFPVGSGDVYVSDLLKRGHDFVWDKNQGQDETYDLVEETKVGSVGFMNAWHDETKGIFGRIMFEEVKDPTIIYWARDSKKRDYSDSHLIKAQKRTKKYIKETYGDKVSAADMKFDVPVDEPSVSTGNTGGDDYNLPPDLPPEEDKEKNVWEIEAWMLKKVDRVFAIYQPENEPMPRIVMLNKGKQTTEEAVAELKVKFGVEQIETVERRVEVRELRIIVGKKLLFEEENPFGVDSDGDPIIGIVPLRHDRTLTSYGTCPTFKALPINKEKNKRRSQYIYAASMDIVSPITQGHDTKWEGRPGTPGSVATIGKNATIRPERMTGGATNIGAFLTLEAEADRDIDDQYDMSEVMRGKIPPGQENASGRLILALQDTAGLMAKPFLRKLETTIVRLARVNVALMLKHWPRFMWERLLEDDEFFKPPVDSFEDVKRLETATQAQEGNQNAQEVEKIQDDIQKKWMEALEKVRPIDTNKEPEVGLMDLDIRMTVGSSLPTNRMAKAGVAIDLVKAGIYDRKAALEYVDDPKVDEIEERMEKAEERLAQNTLRKG